MLARLARAAPPRPSVVLRRHRDAIIAIAERHKAHDVRVFGSTARGVDTSGSDLDLLVRMDADADAFDLAELIEDLKDVTGVAVDVVSEAALRSGRARSATRRARCERDAMSDTRQTLRDLIRLAETADRLVSRGRSAYDADDASGWQPRRCCTRSAKR